MGVVATKAGAALWDSTSARMLADELWRGGFDSKKFDDETLRTKPI